MNQLSLAADSSITDIINFYSNMIYKLAIIQTKNKADAEDVFQEVLLRYIRNKTSFNNEEH